MKKLLKIILIIILLVALLALALLVYLSVTEYKPEPIETVAVESYGESGTPGTTLTVASWNIGYCGLGKNADFTMDGGTGDGKPESREEFEGYFNGVVSSLSSLGADVYLLQEVDADSTRSYRTDETTVIPQALASASAAFALNYSCDFVPYPLPPIGRVNGGVLTLTGLELTEAERVALPCPFEWPLRIANLKRCLLTSRVDIPDSDAQLVLVNLHLEAYDSGEGKAAQTAALMGLIEEEYNKGNYVIAGGDFNQTFPGGLEAYPVQRDGLWTPGTLEASDLPEGFSFAYDTSSPSCRSLDRPLDASDPDFQYYLIDGFIVSPNVTVESVSTVDLGFLSSDHNPVLMTVTLEGLAPEQPVEPEGETREFTLTMEGMEETVSMTKTPFDLSYVYGPMVEMYMDTERFETYTFEGEHYIVPTDSGEAPIAWLHLACLSDTADINAEQALLNPYYEDATDEGMVKLGEYDAYCVRYSVGEEGDAPGLAVVYFIPWEDMTIAITVFSTYEAADGMLTRLGATANSIIIK